MDFKKLTQGERIVIAAGALLILDLLFLPWHSIKVSGGLVSVKVTRSGIESPNPVYGVLALILALVMVVQVALSRLTSVKVPDLPVPWSQVHMIAGAVVLALLLLKLVVETDFLGFGAYVGLVLAAALAFGGFSIRKEAGAAAGGTAAA